MKKKITFSIITPVLNSDRFIKKTLLSIKRQSFQNFEHIIIDGGSTDKTLKIIKKYRNKKTKILVKKDRVIIIKVDLKKTEYLKIEIIEKE